MYTKNAFFRFWDCWIGKDTACFLDTPPLLLLQKKHILP